MHLENDSNQQWKRIEGMEKGFSTLQFLIFRKNDLYKLVLC